MFVLLKEKRKMKSKKNNRKAQFGRIGVISLMALSLSSQSLYALDLWYITGPKKDQKLESLLDTDKTEAIDLLSKFEAVKFVEKFASQPVKFAEGIKESLIKNESVTDFKDKLKDAFKAVEAAKFGGDKLKETFLKVLDRSIAADLKSDEWLDLVFASSKDKDALNVTSVKPKEKEEAKTEVGEQKDDAEFQAFCDEIRKQKSESDKLIGLLEELKKSNDATKKDFDKERIASQERQKALENQIAQAQAAISAAAEQGNQVDPNALARNQQEKDASDVLNGLLSGLVNDQNKKNAEE
jgi:hypothetical protein